MLVSALCYCNFKILSDLHSIEYVKKTLFLDKIGSLGTKSLGYYELTAKFAAAKFYSHHRGLATQISENSGSYQNVQSYYIRDFTVI